MEGTLQLLLCANYIRLFGNNVATTKENTRSPLVISNGDGLLIRGGVGEKFSVPLCLVMSSRRVLYLCSVGSSHVWGRHKNKNCVHEESRSR
jgi:hypothetical protein